MRGGKRGASVNTFSNKDSKESYLVQHSTMKLLTSFKIYIKSFKIKNNNNKDKLKKKKKKAWVLVQ